MRIRNLYIRSDDVPVWDQAESTAAAAGMSLSRFVSAALRRALGAVHLRPVESPKDAIARVIQETEQQLEQIRQIRDLLHGGTGDMGEDTGNGNR